MARFRKRHRLAMLPLAVGALLMLLALAAGALAMGEDMSEMHGMTDEEMQGMHEQMPDTQAPGSAAAGGDPGADQGTDGHGAGHGVDAAAGTHDAVGAASAAATVNWIVIGGFIVLVAGSTLAAVATKRHLRRRMLAGELATAGVRDV